MEQQGIDKLEATIEDIMEVIPDVIEAKKSDDKITWMEGGALVLKHGGKAIRFISSVEEIAKQIIDIDDVEASTIYDKLQSHFGGTDEAKVAAKKIVIGCANISQGIQELIAIKKVD